MNQILRESEIPYEASQADMEAFSSKVGWKPERQLEDTIPLIIEYERSQLAVPETRPPGNILITSAGRKVPLLIRVKEAAAKFSPNIKVFSGDLSANSIAHHLSDGILEMQKLDENSLEYIIENCRALGISHIIPTRDGELEFFASNRKALMYQGIKTMISDHAAVEICLDKLRFAEFCVQSELPCIPTFEFLPADATGKWVVKERFGAGSLSMGLNLELDAARAHASALSRPVYQPFLSGMQEFSADMYVDSKGSFKGSVIRTRDLVVNGESQISTTTTNHALDEVCHQLARKLPFYGHIIVQAFADEMGNVKLIEVNPRFGGASTLAVEAGLDSFFWFLIEASGGELDGHQFLSRAGKSLRLVRYPADHFQTLNP
jgi:carbamoyl-phosphate synthase large subunit